MIRTLSIDKLKREIFSIILQQIRYNSENENKNYKRESYIRKPLKEV